MSDIVGCALSSSQTDGSFYLCGDNSKDEQVLNTSVSSVEGSFGSRSGPFERQ